MISLNYQFGDIFWDWPEDSWAVVVSIVSKSVFYYCVENDPSLKIRRFEGDVSKVSWDRNWK